MRLPTFYSLMVSLTSLALFVGGCGDDDKKKDALAMDAKTSADAPTGTLQDAGVKLDGALADRPPSTADAPQSPDAPQQRDGAVDSGLILGDGGISLAQVSALFENRCIGCHSGTGAAAARLNLSENSDAGTLRARLLAPLPLEAYCGMPDGGVGSDAGARRAIVPGDLTQSFLYLKVMNQQPSPGTSVPATCGTSMPRVRVPGPDGGAAQVLGCDLAPGGAAANCLSPTELALIREWILQGAQ